MVGAANDLYLSTIVELHPGGGSPLIPFAVRGCPHPKLICSIPNQHRRPDRAGEL